MRIVAMSDTHNRIPPDIPDGDLLIHAGDATDGGSLREVTEFAMWFNDLSHPYKIFVPGNHDFLFQQDPARARRLMAGTHVLMDESVKVYDRNIYGSPWTILYGGWAFMEGEAAQKTRYDAVAANAYGILATHGPPYGILDKTFEGDHAGSKALAAAIDNHIRPSVHIFGHIHESRGAFDMELPGKFAPMVRYYNVACDDFSEWLRPPVVIEVADP